MALKMHSDAWNHFDNETKYPRSTHLLTYSFIDISKTQMEFIDVNA